MVLSSVLLGVLFPRFYGDICFVAGIVFATVAFQCVSCHCGFHWFPSPAGFSSLRWISLPAGFCLAWLRTPKKPRGISWHFGPRLGAVKNLYIIHIYIFTILYCTKQGNGPSCATCRGDNTSQNKANP